MAENFLKQDENQIQEARWGQSKIHKTRYIVRKNCKRQNQWGGDTFKETTVSLTADFLIATIQTGGQWKILKALRDRD